MSDTPTSSVSPAEYQRLLSESIRRKERVRELLAKLAAAEETITGLTTERDEYAEALDAIATERDDLQTQLNTQPDELRAKVEELTGQIRGQKHHEKFKALATGKVNPEAIDTAWGLLGWTPDADEVDEPRMTAAIDDLVGRHAVLKIPANPNGEGGNGVAKTQQQPRAAGPGTGRGAQPVARDPDAELAIRYPNPGRLA